MPVRFQPFLPFVLFFVSINQLKAQGNFTVSSPDKKIVVTAWINEANEARYKVQYDQEPVMKESKLGLIREDEDFSRQLKALAPSAVQTTRDQYQLFTGKKSWVKYTATKRTFHLQNKNGKKLDVIFQVSNDGVAFRYFFPERIREVKTIQQEITSFHFDTTARGFLQPMQEAKTGWEKTNPAYEEHYQQNIPLHTPSTLGAGWVYPALFKSSHHWVLITEAALESNHCATRLQNGSADSELSIGFPDKREVLPNGGLLPKVGGIQAGTNYASPWRIITIGSLKTIVESTLGTDLAKPTPKVDFSYVKPGKASWSWIMSKDDSIVYNEQVRYIDFASRMNWQYCLVDVSWDRKIGYDRIKELSQYANSKKVGLLLWYNSAGDWNTVKYTPKSKLLTKESRAKEFSLLKELGVKGIKIDFFGGDGQSVIQYYLDILNDAAQAGLMINFHGATIPRGWHRTYPNLVTAEAVRGFEMITFEQKDADAAANHCAMLPFTRNAFDPMDFTPMNLYQIPTRVKRKTTSAFELATAVLFLSGIQHFAESPAGMSHVPGFVQGFLQTLPNRWDDVKFLDGYPGKHVVIARRAGKKWYVAGINGENSEKALELDLTQLKAKKGILLTDGQEPQSFATEKIESATKKRIGLKPNGGFVMVLE